MKDDGLYLADRCWSCGHRLRFMASHCPQCNVAMKAKDPKKFPEKCQCDRCTEARKK